MNNIKAIFWKLYQAKDAKELHEIVLNDPILSNQDNWKPYGGNKNNCGTFEGQQAKPEAALVEKITNSIDAILMKECMARGINPKDSTNPELPRTMTEAVESFFGVEAGKWENSTEAQRRQLATKLQIVVTEDRKTPNIVIYDNGEGQNPENFEQTFLSLLSGNKMEVPFVQGKFNMGSTGAMRFCGDDEKYQMIISRRNHELEDSNDKIGFTLVRKHILSEEEDQEGLIKATWYEYLTINDVIPSFEEKELDLGLKDTKFTDGSVVKLFSYQLSRGCQSIATLDLWRELNVLLYESSIPVLIYEKRDYAGHSDSKIMVGNKARIAIDDREKKYASKSFSISDKSFSNDEIPIEVVVFKSEIKEDEFIRKRPVIFLMNGQTQGFEGRPFISNELNMRQIRDNILISVDCTKILTSMRNDLFMSSRDRMSEGKNYNKLKEKIIDILKNDEDLKRINQEFKNAVMRESKDDKELIQNLFSNLKDNKEIKNLFSGREGIFSFFNKKIKEPDVERTSNPKERKSKKLGRFPSVLRVLNLTEKDGKLIKCINKGSKGTLKLETDADNEFLTRNVEKGEFEITILEFGNKNHPGPGPTPKPGTPTEKIRVSRSGPYEGEIKVILEPSDEVEVGDWFEISMKLISIAGEHEVKVMVSIEQEITNSKKTQKNREEPDVNLPKAIRVFSEKKDNDTCCWADIPGMNADSVVDFAIGDNNLIDTIYINMDSNLIKKLTNKSGAEVKLISDKYFAAIYTHSLMVYSTLIGYFSSDNIELDERAKEEIKDKLEEAIKFIFKPYAAFLLSFDIDNMSID